MSCTSEAPLIYLPAPGAVQQGTLPAGTSTVLTLPVKKGSIVVVSVALEEVTAGAVLTFTGQGQNEVLRVGAELGTTRYVAAFDITSITLTSYSATSDVFLNAWLAKSTHDARPSCDTCK